MKLQQLKKIIYQALHFFCKFNTAGIGELSEVLTTKDI